MACKSQPGIKGHINHLAAASCLLLPATQPGGLRFWSVQMCTCHTVTAPAGVNGAATPPHHTHLPPEVGYGQLTIVGLPDGSVQCSKPNSPPLLIFSKIFRPLCSLAVKGRQPLTTILVGWEDRAV